MLCVSKSNTFIIDNFLVLVEAHDQHNLPTWEELAGDSILMDFNLEFDVNYSSGKVLGKTASTIFMSHFCDHLYHP